MQADAAAPAAARRLLPGCGIDPGNERACRPWRPSVPLGALLADGRRGECGMIAVVAATRWGDGGALVGGADPESAREPKSAGSWRPRGEMVERGRRVEALGVLAVDLCCCCCSS